MRQIQQLEHNLHTLAFSQVHVVGTRMRSGQYDSWVRWDEKP